MRSWIAVTATALALAAAGLSAPAQAGTPPSLQFGSSPSGDFGTLAVGSSLDRTFMVTNVGGSATAALKIALAAGPFTVPAGGDLCTATSLGPKKSCTITVRYTPAAAGAHDTATLTASAKKPTIPATLGLSGSGPAALSSGCDELNANPGGADFSPYLFNAGEVVTLVSTSESATMQVQNPIGSDFVTIGTATPGSPVTYAVLASGTIVFRVGVALSNDWSWSCDRS